VVVVLLNIVTNNATIVDTIPPIPVIKAVWSLKKVTADPKLAANPAPTIDTHATIF
jgi:hypothetical protein